MLRLENIKKSFAGHFTPTLQDLNLELPRGEFCILVGSNGSGKSTLLRCISGEYKIGNGKIILGKQDLTQLSLSARAKFISSVTQDINIGTIAEMTLLENLVLSELRGKSSKLKLYEQRAAEIFNIVKQLGVGLEKYLHSPLQILSGGQRQMIATLMAINSHPQVLLLDEHTSALDPKTQNILMRYTADGIKSHGITSIMITHKLEDAIRFGDRLIMMHQGKIVLDVNGEAKRKLQVSKLLELFHRYEDLILK